MNKHTFETINMLQFTKHTSFKIQIHVTDTYDQHNRQIPSKPSKML